MNLYETKVLGIRKETSDSYSVKCEIPEGYTWTPGQYTMWQYKDHKVSEGDKPSRIFSIASSMDDNYLMFTTRIDEKHTSWKDFIINGLKVGDIMLLAKANGSFSFHKDKNKSFAVAGGIGITPIRSMLSHLANNNLNDHEFTVIYADNRGEYCYGEDFKIITEKMENLNLVLESDNDKVSALVEDYIKKFANESEYLIAGSPGMNKAFSEKFVALGINEDGIKVDNFMGY